MLRRISLCLALPVSAACSSARPSTQPTPAAVAREPHTVLLRLENHSSCDVRVRVEQSGQPLATIRLTGNSVSTRRIAENGTANSVTIVAEPFACHAAPYVAGEIAFGVEAAVVSLEGDAKLSTVRAIDPSQIR